MTMRTLLIAALIIHANAAAAATFIVTEGADLPDLNAGNGFCNVFPQPGPGPCTLRAAIIEANALAGADTIELQNDLADGGTFTLTRAGAGEDGAFTGDLDIIDDLTIRFFGSGERPVVDGGGLDRVFDIISGSVTLLGFDIRGGEATSDEATSGGGVLVRSTAGAVRLTLMRVHQNRAFTGGGLYNFGHDTTLSACEFDDNTFVGDINEVPSGSAIRNRGNLAIAYGSFHHNGGIPLQRPGAPAGNTSSANTIDSEPLGAGTGSIVIANTSLVRNAGNAINAEGAGSLELSSTTIAGNSVRGIRLTGTGSLLMHNSIVAANAFADCFLDDDADLDLDRYNLDSDDTCELAGGTSNRAGVDPRLTPPARHGGLTAASWPLTDSIVLDHGHPLFTATGCENDDQHLHDRPIDFDGDGAALCDIGAIELDSDVIFFEPFDRL